MLKPPSLVNLCASALKSFILYGYDDFDDDDDDDDGGLFQGIYELPTELFDCLVNQFPAVALHKLQSHMPTEKESEFFEYECSGSSRKRVRYGKFDTAWKTLFHHRWPENIKQSQGKSLGKTMEAQYEIECDWQQKYWQVHLQNCFDAAAEKAMIPSFAQCVGLVELPGALIKAIGYEDRAKCSNQDYSKLRSHCQNFGHYVRCLRLQNVFLNAETCQLMASSKLKELILNRVSSQMHVDGLCMILNENKETIGSLEFTNSRISSSFVEQICQSLCAKGTQMHGVKRFAVKSSKFLEANPASWPPKLLTFISSRSLESLEFSDVRIGRNCAKLIFSTLADSSSALSALDLSDNNISGWLSEFRCEVLNQFKPSQDISKSLPSLRFLNLRGNNLRKSDMDDLRSALVYLPVLENLDISDNPIEDDGIKSLIPHFVENANQVPLTNLDLKNCQLSCSGATELLEVLLASKYPLRSLSLADNNLGSQIAPALGDFLSSSIRSLDIRDISLGSAGFLELQINMPSTVNLEIINMSENRGGIQAAEFLKELISRAQELLIVHAGFNLMPPESLNIICSAVDTGKGKLQLIDLMGNHKLSTTDHGSVLAEIQHNGGPTILVPSLHSQEAPYDDDP